MFSDDEAGQRVGQITTNHGRTPEKPAVIGSSWL